MTEASTIRGKRNQRKGVVVEDKAHKTIVVRVERVMRHPIYGKVIRTHKKYHVHDEENRAHKGDLVQIIECRPFSKTKRWRLAEILRGQTRNPAVEEPNDTDADQT